ncbi:MAG: signal peptidase [Solirubrobacteraceae bacterium]|jgi:signal peptidase II|nr:signal peptidase [Solirubrobacteraceae bacterium]MEA2358352.1 signal peptidase [Solirubrobacteraceae bacterium]MEA2394026.1 signal peptidase [Solirubrobacteraceae bacterium]
MAGRRGAATRAAMVTALVLALDQVTKAIVRASVPLGDRDRVLPGVELVHARNDGVAFNVLAGGSPLVVVVIAIAVGALVGYFATHLDRPLIWLPTGMLLGGALGNIVDRVRDGAVTDFIKLPAWPAFNVADMSITFGVLVLLYVIERPRDGAARDA